MIAITPTTTVDVGGLGASVCVIHEGVTFYRSLLTTTEHLVSNGFGIFSIEARWDQACQIAVVAVVDHRVSSNGSRGTLSSAIDVAALDFSVDEVHLR